MLGWFESILVRLWFWEDIISVLGSSDGAALADGSTQYET